MDCPYCGNKMMIFGSYIRVRGDQSDQTETVVEQVLKYECRNFRCTRKKEEREKAERIY